MICSCTAIKHRSFLFWSPFSHIRLNFKSRRTLTFLSPNPHCSQIPFIVRLSLIHSQSQLPTRYEMRSQNQKVNISAAPFDFNERFLTINGYYRYCKCNVANRICCTIAKYITVAQNLLCCLCGCVSLWSSTADSSLCCLRVFWSSC